MTTKEHAAAIRADYKRHGWTGRDISVKIDVYSMGSSIHVVIKNPAVPIAVATKIAEGHETIRRDQFGEILGGGNRYVHVSYSYDAKSQIERQYLDVLTAAKRALHADASDNSLHPIGDTGFLLGKGTNGYGYSLWKDGYLTSANDAIHLATAIHGRL